jgi:zinc D-Ala-D-Ala dipeptidase
MHRPLSSFDYRGFLRDPDQLDVPVNFVVSPLPELREPKTMPAAPVPAPGDGEPLVQIVDRRVRVLSTYWHVGWEQAIPGALVRSGVAERLSAAAAALPEQFGLAVFDAWRPLPLQAEIFQAAYADPTLPPGFVSEPSGDPSLPPPHLTGGTVDVTLTWNSHPLALGSSFDDFTDEAHTAAYESIPGRVRQLRRLLFWAMYDQGFSVVDCEWWHFEYGTRRWAALRGTQVLYGAATRLSEPDVE